MLILCLLLLLMLMLMMAVIRALTPATDDNCQFAGGRLTHTHTQTLSDREGDGRQWWTVTHRWETTETVTTATAAATTTRAVLVLPGVAPSLPMGADWLANAGWLTAVLVLHLCSLHLFLPTHGNSDRVPHTFVRWPILVTPDAILWVADGGQSNVVASAGGQAVYPSANNTNTSTHTHTSAICLDWRSHGHISGRSYQ